MRRSHRYLLAALSAAILVAPAHAGDPRRAQHFITMGLEAMKVGEMGKAEDAFERARASDPTLPQPEILLGQVAMAQQRFDDAEGCYLRAIDLYGKLDANRRIEGQRDAMQAQDDIDRLSDGLAQGENAPRRGMTTSEVMRQETQKERLEQQANRDERERAKQMTEAAVPADVYMYLGNARMRAGRPEPAAEAYREAIARAPEAAEPHHNLAAALASAGKLQEALQECRTAEQLGFEPSKQLREQLEKVIAAAPPKPDPDKPKE